MTIALCLNCGEMKFGAICECPNCETSSTGEFGLDIAFSDWSMSEEHLKEFGNVIAYFKNKTNDPDIAFLAFIRYVSENYSSIFYADISDDFAQRVDEIYNESEIPVVTFIPSLGSQQSEDADN
jgi:hypothetical protein